MKYQTKTEIVEATQWFKNGDHPLDDVWRKFEDTGAHPTEPREGKIVRYFRHPNVPGETICDFCSIKIHHHGWIDQGGKGLTVCPGDYVITLPGGMFATASPKNFEKRYTDFKDPDAGCEWKNDGEGNFKAGCTGLPWALDALQPSDCGFHFCPHCGKKIIVKS